MCNSVRTNNLQLYQLATSIPVIKIRRYFASSRKGEETYPNFGSIQVVEFEK